MKLLTYVILLSHSIWHSMAAQYSELWDNVCIMVTVRILQKVSTVRHMPWIFLLLLYEPCYAHRCFYDYHIMFNFVCFICYRLTSCIMLLMFGNGSRIVLWQKSENSAVGDVDFVDSSCEHHVYDMLEATTSWLLFLVFHSLFPGTNVFSSDLMFVGHVMQMSSIASHLFQKNFDIILLPNCRHL